MLEQLTNLTSLSFRHTDEHYMSLDRSLEPLLELPSLQELKFYFYNRKPNTSLWTPAALRLLGLAQQRTMEMEKAPGSKSINLCCTDISAPST